MANTIDGFTFFRSFYEALMEMKPADRHTMYDAIMAYTFEGKEPDLKNSVQRMMFKALKPNLDSGIAARVSGKKGGRPSNSVTAKDTEDKRGVSEIEKGALQKNKKQKEEEIEIEQEIEIELEQEKSKGKKFSPPTIEEVREYIMQNKLDVPVEKWWHYYNARDWCLSKGQKMKNWKSAVHTWDRRNHDGSSNTNSYDIAGTGLRGPGDTQDIARRA